MARRLARGFLSSKRLRMFSNLIWGGRAGTHYTCHSIIIAGKDRAHGYCIENLMDSIHTGRSVLAWHLLLLLSFSH
jgi:hypothetical protein